jgi:hypothetical protein
LKIEILFVYLPGETYQDMAAIIFGLENYRAAPLFLPDSNPTDVLFMVSTIIKGDIGLRSSILEVREYEMCFFMLTQDKRRL